MGKPRLYLVLANVLALLPLVSLVADFALGRLGANPIRDIQLRTGLYTLNFLVLALACTPVYAVTGLKLALRLRQLLGIYSFVYAAIHFLNFIGLDYGFNFPLIWTDLADKRYVLAGMAAFVILLALAVTSTNGWRRRLGRGWKRLHRLVYLAALIAVLHFIWQTKADLRLPFLYAGVVMALLVFRVPWVKRWAGWGKGPLGNS